MTLLVGTIQNLVGQNFSDFTLTATPTVSYYNATGGFVAQAGVNFSAASGTLSANIPETETSGVFVAFSAHYTAEGIYNQLEFFPVIIPNVEEVNISDLLFVIPPTEG